MAYLRAYQLPDGSCIVDVQSDLVYGMRTRIVAPLLHLHETPKAIRKLHPIVSVKGERRVIATHLLASVSDTILKEEIANLTSAQDEVTAALDMLFHGF